MKSVSCEKGRLVNCVATRGENTEEETKEEILYHSGS